MEAYGRVLEQELGIKDYHCAQKTFVKAWIALGCPIVNELHGDLNWDKDMHNTLTTFDGAKLRQKELAMDSYTILMKIGKELIDRQRLQKFLLLDPMFVLHMEKFCIHYSQKVEEKVRWVVAHYKHAETKMEALAKVIEALEEEIEDLRAEKVMWTVKESEDESSEDEDIIDIEWSENRANPWTVNNRPPYKRQRVAIMTTATTGPRHVDQE
jgi:thiamine pyrophosphate-dependent acetolactate synthase large subunit-like protein